MKNANSSTPVQRRDIHQQVTDTIINQLEAGVIPWKQPWNDGRGLLGLPHNFTTGNRYRGINIVLLWGTSLTHGYSSTEWASYKQWQEKDEAVRKDEKGTMIVFYGELEKEVEGEIKKIPYLKCSHVFNRCQLVSYSPPGPGETVAEPVTLVERIEAVDTFITNTGALIEHRPLDGAYYQPLTDKIVMPLPESFIDMKVCTATEGYYSVTLHELTHWTGHEKRMNRKVGKKFGDAAYAGEELVAEFGAAFMCAGFGIRIAEKGNTALTTGSRYFATIRNVLLPQPGRPLKQWIFCMNCRYNYYILLICPLIFHNIICEKERALYI